MPTFRWFSPRSARSRRALGPREDESQPPVLPDTPRRPLTPGTADPDLGLDTSLSHFGYFARLPFEIRRQILVEAFGNQTLHVDLAFRRPFSVPQREKVASPGQPGIPEQPHAQIYCSHTYFEDGNMFWKMSVDKSQPEAWRWFGCVCHRSPGPSHQALGVMASEAKDLSADGCLLGKTECTGWPGPWPERCFIGIMGWLLCCRQAYSEGINVLYSANTIHMSSDVLVQDPCSFLPAPRRAHMTSAELRWRISDEWPTDVSIWPLLPASTSASASGPSHGTHIFPALKFFHLSLEGDFHQLYGKREHGKRVPFNSNDEGIDAMEEVLLPRLDEAVQRYAPPSARCVVSLFWLYCQPLFKRAAERGARFDDPWPNPVPNAKSLWREIPESATTLAGDGHRWRGRGRGYFIREQELMILGKA